MPKDVAAQYDVSKGKAPDLQTVFTRQCHLQQALGDMVIPPGQRVNLGCESATAPAGADARKIDADNRTLENTIHEYGKALKVSPA